MDKAVCSWNRTKQLSTGFLEVFRHDLRFQICKINFEIGVY